MEIQKNELVEFDVTGTSHDGFGVGRIGNFVIFTPSCARGDRIKAQILKVKKNMAYAKLIEVIVPSEARIKEDCGVFARCGGCVFRHISYLEELDIKYQRVADALKKIARLELKPEDIIGSSVTDGYRNKAEYPVAFDGETVRIGFYARNSHRVVDSRSCLLQPKAFELALGAFEDWIKTCHVPVYDELTGQGIIRHIYLRQAPGSGEVMACAVINAEKLPGEKVLIDYLRRAVPTLASVIVNQNRRQSNAILGKSCETIWGKDKITGIFCGLKIEMSPLSFYQVNSRQAEILYGIAKDFASLSGKELLLDLYCGAGTIGLSMADRAKKVIGVEIVREACDDAKRNAEINGIRNAEFLCADAEAAAKMLCEKNLKPDVVVVDPPRKGCSSGTIDAIVRMNPVRVVYVSCNPETLARDLVIFGEQGFCCSRVKPVDLFPRTAHVECVALMTNCRPDR